MKKNMRTKINAVVEKAWPYERAAIAQLEFEGAYWHDEGTHVALMVWKPANENEVVALTIPFQVDGTLGEFEECFGGLDDLIQDESWERY
jgi:hypothetical protein